MMLDLLIATVIGGLCAGAGTYWSTRLNSDHNVKKMIWSMRFEKMTRFLDVLSHCRNSVQNHLVQCSSTGKNPDRNFISGVFNAMNQEGKKIRLLLKSSERENFSRCLEEIIEYYLDDSKVNLKITLGTLQHIFEEHLDELNLIDDDSLIFEESENL